jgi:hypothetical protein
MQFALPRILRVDAGSILSSGGRRHRADRGWYVNSTLVGAFDEAEDTDTVIHVN